MANRSHKAQQGFSLLETALVMVLVFIVAGFALMSLVSTSDNSVANNATDTLISQLRQAREVAIAKRRNVEVQFTPPNQIQVTVLTLPGEAVPPANPPVFLNSSGEAMSYYVFPGQPDTPMGFGNSQAINLQEPGGGGAWSVMFTTSGAFVGSAQSASSLYAATNNNPVNASIFIGIPGKTNTARAITVFGATGRVRPYHWTGSSWQE